MLPMDRIDASKDFFLDDAMLLHCWVFTPEVLHQCDEFLQVFNGSAEQGPAQSLVGLEHP